MLESLTTLASLDQSSTNISDSVLQLDCLRCVRAILSRRDGLQLFLDCQHNVDKLVQCQYRAFLNVSSRFAAFFVDISYFYTPP